jgi:NAD+ dependent glucose-6-phosphate dehydrogenase
MNRKKILLLGGMGKIGRILQDGLRGSYDVLVADVVKRFPFGRGNYVHIDVTNFNNLRKKVNPDIDVIVNLVGLPEKGTIVTEEEAEQMCNVYVLGSYNVFLIAKLRKIPKVIFASTNHVTGNYESNGYSKLGRPIDTSDYPSPDSTYGAMRACAELLGFVFSNECPLSVISLRIGTVRNEEIDLLKSNDRAKRTLLSKVDTVNLFKAAIEAHVRYGVYYGVSDNPNRPWAIENAIRELPYAPTTSVKDLMQG